MLQIQQFYNELLKSGRVQKKNQPELKEHGLSPRMVQCVHVVLNKALEHAVEEKLILANPAKKCKIPKNTRKEMNILPEALIGPYLSAAKEHGILAPMYLELTTGLRRGELLALRWEDMKNTQRIRICSRLRARVKRGTRMDSVGCTAGSSKKSARNMCVFMTCDTHSRRYP